MRRRTAATCFCTCLLRTTACMVAAALRDLSNARRARNTGTKRVSVATASAFLSMRRRAEKVRKACGTGV